MVARLNLSGIFVATDRLYTCGFELTVDKQQGHSLIAMFIRELTYELQKTQ